MEWSRACCRSKWRLIRGSDRLRDGFFYFSPPDTPFYAGFTNLGSRDWTSDEREPWPELGEWQGARQWYGGDPPAVRTLPVLVGDPDCIANGERPGLPVIPDQSAECAKVLPDPCYAVEETTFAKTNILDCAFAKVTADFIALAYTDLAAAEAAVAAYLGPMAVVSSFPQPTALIPAGVIAVIGDTAVLWLTGTTNFNQLAVQAFYSGTGPINQGLYSASALYEAAAVAVADALNAAGAGASVRTVLTGHSYGGAVCMVLAAKMLIANPDRKVEVLTIGAPQPGDQRLHDLIAFIPQRHYANERDPIPYLPPRGLTFAGLLPIIGPLLALIWPTFVRAPHVVTVTRDGQLINERTDDLPDELIAIAVIAIAAALDVPSFIAHRSDWYAFYLCNACKCVPRPCIAPDELDVGFEVRIDDFEYTFEGVPAVINVPRVALTVIERYPSGKARAWESAPLGSERVIIEAVVDVLDNYTDFSLKYEPPGISPIFLCEWDFTAAEMLAGVATISFPDTFTAPDVGDGVTTLGGLFVFPTLT